MRDHTHDSRTGHGYINLSVGTEFTVFTDDADWLRSLAFVANSAADALDGVVSDPESTKPLRGTIGQPIPAGALGEGIETDAVVDHCSPW
jgi:hypothetical protein